MIDKIALLAGKPVRFNSVLLYSPKIDDITQPDIGESQYSLYLLLASFNKKSIYVHVLGVPLSKYQEFADIDDYDFLTSDENLCEEICTALSFFVHEEVTFDYFLKKFKTKMGTFLSKENYKEFVEVLLLVNGGFIEEKKEESRPKFANKAAEEMYENMLRAKEAEEEEKRKREKGGDKDFDLKDILSILCNFDGNGINVFNIKDLTIFQVYEQFERMNLKEAYARALPVWANGYWNTKKNPFPEWIKKTRL